MAKKATEMKLDPQTQPEISGWWFTGFLAMFVSAIGIMIAANADALRMLSRYYLMGLFILSGAALATLVMNAVGLGKKWELARESGSETTAQTPKITRTLEQKLYAQDSSYGAYESEIDTSESYETTTESNFIRRRQPRRRAS